MTTAIAPPTADLIEAIVKNDMDAFRSLLAEGVNINAATEDRGTPLFRTVVNGRLDMAAALLDAGANIEGKSGEEGYTALHRAVEGGSKPFIEFLLERGANINAVDDHGNTPLVIAAKMGTTDAAMQLISSGANVHIANRQGNTALMIASAVHKAALMEELIEHGADVHQRNNDGETPLLLTAQKGSMEKLRQLIHNNEVQAFAMGGAGGPYAVAAVEVLCRHKALIDETDSEGATPLILATRDGMADIALELVKNGADVLKTDAAGATAYDAAAGNGHTALAQKLQGIVELRKHEAARAAVATKQSGLKAMASRRLKPQAGRLTS